QEGMTWGGGLQVPGAPGYSAYFGTSGNQHSQLYDSAAFLQDDVRLAPQVSLIPGFRADYLDAVAKNPAFVQVGADNENTDFSYVPVTPTYLAPGSIFDTKAGRYDPSYFVSLVWKPAETRSLYVTYDRVDAVLGSDNFGGLDVAPSGNVGVNPGGGLVRSD